VYPHPGFRDRFSVDSSAPHVDTVPSRGERVGHGKRVIADAADLWRVLAGQDVPRPRGLIGC
jgi:hypothetical protein